MVKLVILLMFAATAMEPEHTDEWTGDKIFKTIAECEEFRDHPQVVEDIKHVIVSEVARHPGAMLLSHDVKCVAQELPV